MNLQTIIKCSVVMHYTHCYKTWLLSCCAWLRKLNTEMRLTKNLNAATPCFYNGKVYGNVASYLGLQTLILTKKYTDYENFKIYKTQFAIHIVMRCFIKQLRIQR